MIRPTSYQQYCPVINNITSRAVNFKKRIIFLKSAVPTAARGTRAPKRTVLKKNLLTTLNAINPAGSFSNVIRTWKIVVYRGHIRAQVVF